MESQFNPFSLEGKVIVISGAASGIARQCAINCSKMGAKLILLDLNEEGLKETMGMVERPEEHYWASVNLLEYDRVGEIIKEAVGKVGRDQARGVGQVLPCECLYRIFLGSGMHQDG